MKSLRIILGSLLFVFALTLGISVAFGIRSLQSSVPAVGSESNTTECISQRQEPPFLAVLPTAGEEDTDVSEEGDVSSIETSPYAIRSFIDEHPRFAASELWGRLGISEESATPFFSNCENCTAQLDTGTVGEFRGTALLRIENGGTEETRYLLFKQEEQTSVLIGFIDHSFGRYEMPSHRWVENNGRTFLVVRGQTISGTGVVMYADRLFTLSRNKLIELAWYPGEGHEFMTCAEPGLEFFGKLNEVRGPVENVEIRVDLEVRRTTCSGVDLGKSQTKKRRLVFNWSAKDETALFNKSASNVSDRELAVLNDLMGLGE